MNFYKIYQNFVAIDGSIKGGLQDFAQASQTCPRATRPRHRPRHEGGSSLVSEQVKPYTTLYKQVNTFKRLKKSKSFC
jgi:hypothetical protein